MMFINYKFVFVCLNGIHSNMVDKGLFCMVTMLLTKF